MAHFYIDEANRAVVELAMTDMVCLPCGTEYLSAGTHKRMSRVWQ